MQRSRSILDDAEACHAAYNKRYLRKGTLEKSRALGPPQAKEKHLAARRRRGKCPPIRRKAKILQNERLMRRPSDAQVRLTKQEATAYKLCMVDHLHLKYFVSAVHLLAALKVFSSANASWELLGTRERDNEDEKR